MERRVRIVMPDEEWSPLINHAHHDHLYGDQPRDVASVVKARSTLHDTRLRAYRTLALLCVFDLLFCVLLWALVCGGFQGHFNGSYIVDSVEHFRFQTSLFDVVGLAFVRVLVLLMAYWVCWTTKSYMIIATTSLSTIALLVKVFYYEFGASHATDYLVFIASFALPWAEAWFYISRISPLNKKLAELYSIDVDALPSTSGPVLPTHHAAGSAVKGVGATNGYQQQAASSVPRSSSGPSAFSTPRRGSVSSADYQSGNDSAFATPEEAEDVAFDRPPAPAEVSRALNQLSPQDVEYIRVGSEAAQQAWERSINFSGWALEAEKSGVKVSSLTIAGRKCFRSEGLVYATPPQLFELLWTEAENEASWNRDVAISSTLQKVDNHTAVRYNVMNSLSTMVGKRDAVYVAHWRQYDTSYSIGMTSVTHTKRPQLKMFSRAEFGQSGMVLIAMEGQPHVTNLVRLWDVDLSTKWTADMFAHQAVRSMLVRFHENVRTKLEHDAAGNRKGGDAGGLEV